MNFKFDIYPFPSDKLLRINFGFIHQFHTSIFNRNNIIDKNNFIKVNCIITSNQTTQYKLILKTNDVELSGFLCMSRFHENAPLEWTFEQHMPDRKAEKIGQFLSSIKMLKELNK